MRFKLLVSSLLLASLICISCSDTKSNQADQNKKTPTEKTEDLVASPIPVTNGFPKLTSLKGTGQLGTPADSDKFTFFAFGDNRDGANITEKIFAKIAQEKPAFAFNLGDIVEGEREDPNGSREVMQGQYNKFLEIAKTGGVPIFNAPGNHEMVQKKDGWEIPNQTMGDYYTQNVAAAFFGSFDYGNSHFIALNTSDFPTDIANDCPPKPKECSYISQNQINELIEDLDANKGKTHIFIMMHYPVHARHHSDKLSENSLNNLKTNVLDKYTNISYILASHEHLYYNHNDPGNFETDSFSKGGSTRYLVSGGAGAPLDTRDNYQGAFYHYLKFEVDGDNISVTINKIGSD